MSEEAKQPKSGRPVNITPLLKPATRKMLEEAAGGPVRVVAVQEQAKGTHGESGQHR